MKMKKLTALLLALCMLLAMVPALGEDFSGTWYMVLEDVTVGTLELNADGAFSLTVQAGEESNTLEGTWEATDAGVALTAEGSPAVAAYDAEAGTLLLDVIPIPMQREKGKYEVQLMIDVLNMKEDIEFPEGVTQLEASTAALAFVMKLNELKGTLGGTGTETGTGTEDGGAPDATEAPAGGTGVDILAENFVVTESYSGYDGTYIAKVQNNTGSPLWLTGGSLVVKDASGNLVGTREYLSTCGSKYLEPGEISIATMQVELEADGEYTYEKVIEAEAKSWSGPDAAVTVTDPAYVEGKYDSKLLQATVTNDTEQNLPDVEIAFLLSDENGLPLALVTNTLYNTELCPNSSLVVKSNVYTKVAEYFAAKSIIPAVEAFAWVEYDN
jgi:hypothetical protein